MNDVRKTRYEHFGRVYKQNKEKNTNDSTA